MLVYVAGPYSADTREAVEANVRNAATVAAELWAAGHAVICPHTNSDLVDGILDELGTSLEHADWLRGDLVMLARCDAIVLAPHWENSKGAVMEHEFATQRGLGIYEYPDLPERHPTEVNSPAQCEAFIDTIMRMYRTHLSKNQDYSPANILATGELGVIVRLWDKIARLMNLSGFRVEIASSKFDTSKAPNHEAIEDTYLDAAVYGIIGKLVRDGAWGR